MEVKIKSLGCIITGGGDGIDPIDAFGQFLADRINLADSVQYKTSGNSVMCLFKMAYQINTDGSVETAILDAVSNYLGSDNANKKNYYYFPKSSNGFEYKALNGIGTTGWSGDFWAIAGPRGANGGDTAPNGVIPVSLENLKNFKSFLETQDIELNK